MGRHAGKVYLSSDESLLVSMSKGACKDVCVGGGVGLVITSALVASIRGAAIALR
jgi:hypothetical protein